MSVAWTLTWFRLVAATGTPPMCVVRLPSLNYLLRLQGSAPTRRPARRKGAGLVARPVGGAVDRLEREVGEQETGVEPGIAVVADLRVDDPEVGTGTLSHGGGPPGPLSHGGGPPGPLSHGGGPPCPLSHGGGPHGPPQHVLGREVAVQ